MTRTRIMVVLIVMGLFIGCAGFKVGDFSYDKDKKSVHVGEVDINKKQDN